jgi:hypothetical protein
VSLRKAILIRVRRYAPAEILGIAGAFLASAAMRGVVDDAIVVAYAATVGEVVGFYGTMMVRRLLDESATPTLRAAIQAPLDLHRTSATARELLVEFGPAEVLDTTFVRPLAIATAMSYLGWEWGVPVGKVVADAAFYAVAIASHELQRRRARVGERASEALRDRVAEDA